MATSDPASAHHGSLADLASEAAREVAVLNHELTEIEMLVGQARTEATRHEQKRAQAAEKIAALSAMPHASPAELAEMSGQLVTLTRRAAVMEAQVDVLEGKHKALTRYRDALARYAAGLEGLSQEPGLAGLGQAADADGGSLTEGAAAAASPEGAAAAAGPREAARASDARDLAAALPPAVSRIVLNAQEDLRREIARAMHDGPAQSLTNIVLQAQIVEHLLARDPEKARAEVRQLVSMVQQTLDATKSFIFDVRPMVLDDLGLVPTLRRAARERGRRAQVAVEFDSVGLDRRLPMDLESGLFRILDEALGALLAGHPDQVWIRLDWADQLEARVGGRRAAVVTSSAEAPSPATSRPKEKGKDKGGEMPAALAAMIEDRRADESAAAFAARVNLPASAWREIQQRASTIGVTAELLEDGAELRILADIPPTQ